MIAGTCAACTAVVEAGCSFCIACGVRLDTPLPRTPEPTRTCPDCGSTPGGTDRFCPDCGVPVLTSTCRPDSDSRQNAASPTAADAVAPESPDAAANWLEVAPAAQAPELIATGSAVVAGTAHRPWIDRALAALRDCRPGLAAGTLVLLACATATWASGTPAITAALLTPVVAGAVVAVLAPRFVAVHVDALESSIVARRDRAASANGKFQRWFMRPLFGGCALVWRSTRGVADIGVRAGLRVAVGVYFVSAMAYLLFLVGAALLAIVALCVACVLCYWFLRGFGKLAAVVEGVPARGLEGSPRTVYSGPLPGHPEVVRSHLRRTITGDDVLVHLDDTGKQVGESCEDPYAVGGGTRTVHRNALGERIGESTQKRDLTGHDQVVHSDDAGHTIGTSSEERDPFGGERIVHRDTADDRIGETRQRRGPLGDSYERHSR